MLQKQLIVHGPSLVIRQGRAPLKKQGESWIKQWNQLEIWSLMKGRHSAVLCIGPCISTNVKTITSQWASIHWATVYMLSLLENSFQAFWGEEMKFSHFPAPSAHCLLIYVSFCKAVILPILLSPLGWEKDAGHLPVHTGWWMVVGHMPSFDGHAWLLHGSLCTLLGPPYPLSLHREVHSYHLVHLLAYDGIIWPAPSTSG